MGASLSGNASYAINTAGTIGNPTGGGNPGLSYTKTPTFQFIPVDDSTTAQMLLKPVDPVNFYDLYEQGWRVDQLFRLMVDRIEFRAPGGKYWEVIRNSPTLDNVENYARFLRVSAIAYEMQKLGYLRLEGRKQPTKIVTVLDDGNAPTAKDILDAQTAGLIWIKDKTSGLWELEKKGDVVPVFILNVPTTQAELQNAATEASAAAAVADAAAAAHPEDSAAQTAKNLADTVKAAADAALTAAKTAAADAKAAATAPDDATLAAKAKASAAAAAAAVTIAMGAKINGDMPELAAGGRGGENVETVFLAILQTGFTVEGNVSTTDEDADAEDAAEAAHAHKDSADSTKSANDSSNGVAGPGSDSSQMSKESRVSAKPSPPQAAVTGTVSCHLVMRSLIGVMAAAAQEQGEFEALTANPNLSVPSDAGPVLFTAVVPSVERQPIITLNWKPDAQTLPPLVRLSYRDHDYAITDPKPLTQALANGQSAPAAPGANAAWNRDAFRLIAQLAAQVTVDISKFPIPTILQLNSQ
jgi:hypothetical protein